MSSAQRNPDAAATTGIPVASIPAVVPATVSQANTNSICNIPSTEQPKTKRQKIEKINKNIGRAGQVSSKVINGSRSPSNDTIATTVELSDTNACKNVPASLSSSAHSSLSTSSSLNSSPTSTPSSSRATSLSQLLNVQNIVNILPAPHSGSPPTTMNENNSSNSSERSVDEVDRIAMPEQLPISINASTQNNNLKSTTQTSTEQNQHVYATQDMREFEESLTKQCLCGVSERTLRKPFQSHYSMDANGQKRIANLSEWPTNKLLQFLSNLQLLFDIYLKQNSKGFICGRIMDICDALIRNDNNLIDEIIVLAGYSNSYVQFLAGRVLASFLVIAKQEMDDNWLKKLVDNLFTFERLDCIAVQKIHFSLEIIKRIVEWKDIDLHPLEDEIVDTHRNAGISDQSPTLDGSSDMAAVHSGLDAHIYMHFHTQQPTLDTNYFAVRFRSEHESDRHDHDTVQLHSNTDHNHTIHHSNPQQHEQYRTAVTDAREHSFSHAAMETRTNYMPNESNSPLYPTDNSGGAFSSTPFSMIVPLANNESTFLTGCNIVTLTDSESFDTTQLKCITIKILENKWPALVKNMSALIANHLDIENADDCVLNFLQLWENIISVKANLSIVETLPFYAHLDKFELLLNQNLPCTVYKQMLCLFNEALCYGSTLALQDMLPDETCLLAHQIVRHVKDFRILESLPRRQPENIVGLIGFKQRPIVYNDHTMEFHRASTQQTTNALGHGDGDVIEMDKTILQKMVLLVLKSIAVTVKEIRSDSSDSSIDSTDYEAFQDMVLIERSIRDVLRKLESFIKHTLEFHPECHFSKILIHLFDDQDDHLIEAMVCTLDVTAGISFRNNAFPELMSMLNPVYTFLEFLKLISNSSDLLLDLLVSNETCFLLYLLRFLKYIRMNWTMFVQSCHDFGMGAATLDEAMSVLIRLRLQISRLVSQQLYPYDISPVLRLLESCESLYEGNELS